MTDDDFQTSGQYLAAARSIQDLLDYMRNNTRVDVQGLVVIALSNLAVAEAIHRVASVLEKGTPISVVSTGTIDLDPDKVAATIQAILLRKEE